jgi:uncharacterized protein (UPF0548 family)
MPIRATRAGDTEVAHLRARLRDRSPTYDQVGDTRTGRLPDGYRHDRASIRLGGTSESWTKAQDALRTWRAHRYARATITPVDAALECDTVVVVTVRVGPLFVVAP